MGYQHDGGRAKLVAAVEIAGLRTLYHDGGYSDTENMPCLTPDAGRAREYRPGEPVPGGMVQKAVQVKAN